ncbi:MAG: helix-turn-helix transcriptional regulator [Hyphomicrobiaceae bacterium]
MRRPPTAPTLGLAEAASYVGLSPTTFMREVKAGTLPPPLKLQCRRRLWSRAALDRAIDPDHAQPPPNDRVAAAIDAYDPV